MIICDVCGNDSFRSVEGRPQKLCSKCEAFERHRYLARILKKVENWKDKSFLDIAPLNPLIWKGFLKDLGCQQHTSVDKWRNGNPDDHRDVSFADVYCDVVGMEHVLERKYDIVAMEQVLDEIPDHMGALRSINAVLKPGGTAYIGVAVSEGEKGHQPAPPNRFGNVWKFERKTLIEELSSVFKVVLVNCYWECNWKGHLFQCGKTN